jgi:hypothetical protein
MTVNPSIDPARFLHEQLPSASPDLLRDMLSAFIASLMSAEADALCGAPYGTSSPERVNSRNGYRHRDFDTRAGTLDVAVPKLRTGTYFPDWLLERRKRAEAALTSVVATCYLLLPEPEVVDPLGADAAFEGVPGIEPAGPHYREARPAAACGDVSDGSGGAGWRRNRPRSEGSGE